MFIARSPLNQGVLAHLRGLAKTEILFAPPTSMADPYQGAGSHPDVVERVWDRLGATLPLDARCLAYGTPALVQPVSGILLAFCLGTQYCLRLPAGRLAEALKLGATTTTKWAGGTTTDARLAFGPDWLFGHWLTEELDWCREVFQEFAQVA